MRYVVMMFMAWALAGCGAMNGKTEVNEPAGGPCEPARQINPKQNCLEAAERRIANCPQSRPEHGTVEACLEEAEEQRAHCKELPDEIVAAGCSDNACVTRSCTPANPCGRCTLGKGCVSYYEGRECGWSWGQCYCTTVATGPATCACKCQ